MDDALRYLKYNDENLLRAIYRWNLALPKIVKTARFAIDEWFNICLEEDWPNNKIKDVSRLKFPYDSIIMGRKFSRKSFGEYPFSRPNKKNRNKQTAPRPIPLKNTMGHGCLKINQQDFDYLEVIDRENVGYYVFSIEFVLDTLKKSINYDRGCDENGHKKDQIKLFIESESDAILRLKMTPSLKDKFNTLEGFYMPKNHNKIYEKDQHNLIKGTVKRVRPQRKEIGMPLFAL